MRNKKFRSLTECVCCKCGDYRFVYYDDNNEEYVCSNCLSDELRQQAEQILIDNRDLLSSYDKTGRRME